VHRSFFTSRAGYVTLALATIAIGLLVHLEIVPLGPAARDIAGDALWAAMMLYWIGALVPGARLRTRMVVAFGICAMVELTQLIHTPRLDAVRATRIGHLILGSGFDGRDFVAYAVGVFIAAAFIRRWKSD
jgi:hypothetical protein